ncbi:MAG: diaminopimelate decarboxylase [Nitrospirota bacterium]
MDIYTADGRCIKPPYYIFNYDTMEEDYLRMYQAFSSLYDRCIIAYSYKANYVPYLCRAMHSFGAYAEVVSGLEYDLARRLIGDASRIIFNGPVKSYSELRTALSRGSMVNLDSFYEIDYLRQYCRKNPHKEVSIGVRANFAMPKARGLRVGTSRFGFCMENGDLQQAVSRLHDIPNVKILCLHSHYSSQSRSKYIFQDITARLCEIAVRYLPGEVQYIDIGGNFGRAPREMTTMQFPSFEEYAEIIINELKKFVNSSFHPYLIVEPGISLVGQAFDFVCNVIEVKKIRTRQFVVVDGSVHNIKPTMHRFNLPAQVISPDGNVKDGSKYIYQVVGYTCMEADYLLRNFACSEVKRGDFFLFRNVGAYTVVLNPPFIRPHPPILVKKNHSYKVIRKAETFRDFFATYAL